MGFSFYAPMEYKGAFMKLSSNFQIEDIKQNPHLRHIIEHPADPLYNSFIIRGNSISNYVLQKIKEELFTKHIGKEILYYTSAELTKYIKSAPELLIKNFLKIHPNLLCFMAEDLTVYGLSKDEKNKLALLLKTLVNNKIQVAVTTSLVPYSYGTDSDFVTEEMWSWYMSGREYSLPKIKIIYTKDLSQALTLTEDKKHLKLPIKNKVSRHIGELYNGILVNNPPRPSDIEKHINAPRAICSTCGKAELIPYNFVCSYISGAHIVWFYCANCKECVAANHVLDYFTALQKHK